MAETLKVLIRKRAAIKSKLTNFSNYIQPLQEKAIQSFDEVIITELKQRLEIATSFINEFNDVQTEIEVIVDDDDLDEQFNQRQEFENKFYKIYAVAREILNKNKTPVVNHEINLTDIKLPTINLPRFNGAFDQWITFRDVFLSVIHDNNKLTNVQKFHYLKSSLQGDASQIIQSLELSSDNYENAWKLLVERFENKRLIVQGHVKALFELLPVQKESSVKLRQLCDGVLKHTRALNSLIKPENTLNAIIIHLITSKLDSLTHREWESKNNSDQLSSLEDMTSFLSQKCQLLETLDVSKQPIQNKLPRFQASIATITSCPFCKGDHFIFKCHSFLKLPVSERQQEVKKLRLCFNCLRANHQKGECKAQTCKRCFGKHNTLLHKEQITHENSKQIVSIEQPSTSATCTNAVINTHVLLSTAIVIVKDNQGNHHTCRALLDSGSQSHFITSQLCKTLKLPIKDINTSISGIGQKHTTALQQTTISMKSRVNAYETKLNCLILPKIVDTIPSSYIKSSALQIPASIKLADPQFYEPGPIDLLIGADLYLSLLCVGQIQYFHSQPIYQKTKLGWIISGHISDSYQDNSTQSSSCCLTTIQNDILHQTLERFWKQEEVPRIQKYTEKEAECEAYFEKTHYRETNGRYVVRLPFEDNYELGNSYEMALKRFYSLEKSLNKNPKHREMYNTFMQEYETLNHMTLDKSADTSGYFLPHHAVFKDTSTTTKIRVVFDGSAKSSNGKSLNDISLAGPVVQSDLFSIVIRFRTHNFVLIGDVEKMYRQVNVAPEDRHFQKIIWRYNSNTEPRIYILNTVTYGSNKISSISCN